MDDGRFSYQDDFPDYVKKMETMTNALNDARTKLIQLHGHMGNGEWTGDVKKEVRAFTWLIILYMNQLSGNRTLPCDEMLEALRNFQKQMESFEKDSIAVKNMRETTL